MATACAPFRVLDECAGMGVVRQVADLTRALRHAGCETASLSEWLPLHPGAQTSERNAPAFI